MKPLKVALALYTCLWLVALFEDPIMDAGCWVFEFLEKRGWC